MNWSRFAFVGSVFLLLIFTVGCNSSKKIVSNGVEDFDQFYDRFHADEGFQMSRILFPLEGSSVDADGERIWTSDNWIPLKVKIYDIDNVTYKIDFHKGEDSFVQKFWLPGTGFSAEYRFKRIDNLWYLVYAFDSNL